MKLLVLSAGDLRRALPMPEAVAAMKRAFADLSSGRANVPPRAVLPLDERGEGLFLVKPAVRPGEAFGAKLLSLLPENPARGRPLIQALVVVRDAETGAPTGLCEGGLLTAWRTGAASGAATDLLARPDARRAAIFGAGAQARTQLLAIASVRPLEEIRVYCRTEATRSAFAAELDAEVAARVVAAPSPAEAIEGADVICAATSSATPVFDGAAVADGCHVNGVGSFTPEMREVDGELIRRARVFVDSRASARLEAGELIAAEREGATESAAWTELGEVVEGTRPGRASSREITLFKSVGVAIQDLAAAARALERARELGLGTEIEI